jgi:hypothetical protein
MSKRESRIQLIIMSSIACTLLTLGLLVGPGLASSADLPPRPTPITAPPASPEPPRTVDGGKIVLQTLFGDEWPSTGMNWQDLYTVVQWRDLLGDWYDVSGWQGSLDKVYADGHQVKGMKTWWVPADIFCDGLFRWQVYVSQDGKLLAQSTDFNLPELIEQSVVVVVALTPSNAPGESFDTAIAKQSNR